MQSHESGVLLISETKAGTGGYKKCQTDMDMKYLYQQAR